MTNRVFVDTNVLIYAFAAKENPASKQQMETAKQVLAGKPWISVQILNEFVRVSQRKAGMSWDDIHRALAVIRLLCEPPAPITLELHREGVAIAERYGFRIFDSLIIAAALDTGCTKLYTEDMQHGQIIEGLRIINPFLEPAS